ncbi:MAG: type II toxin-antitoxin system VapB family antitoxin [Bryobacterales bacterium]|nr:type II toxin-antitoxin system VapB family antitoxin [Bryobacterales bacterium]
MKRTSLVLDEEILEEAVRVLGVRTYSATVNLALKEVSRMRRIQVLADHIGKVEWLGDLSEMREDSRR